VDHLALIAVAAAVGGAIAGCHPTGYRVTDIIYPAALALLFSLSAAFTGRSVLLVVAVIGVAMSRGWVLAPAVAAVCMAFASTVPRKAYPQIGAIVGALEIQVVLRWSPHAFQGFDSVVAGVVCAVTLGSGWHRLPRRERRRVLLGGFGLLGLAAVLSAPVAITALQSKGDADRGSTQARAALDDVDRGDAPDAVADLRVAATEFAAAHQRTDAWWTWGGTIVPVIAQQHRAVVDLSGAGQALASGAAQEAGTLDFHRLARRGRIDLPAVEALKGPLDRLDRQIASAEAAARDSRSGWLVAQIADPLAKLDSDLNRAKKSTDLATAAVDQVPDLLGADGTRHYLVVFMTPAEARGLGGFLGAFAEVTVQAGKLTVTRTGLPKNLADPDGVPKLTGPADYLARYGRFDPEQKLEDVGYSPDFPTVAEVLTQVYPQVGGDPVDGVMVLDPYTLAALLQFTGPISVPGFPQSLDSSDAADILLRQQYIELGQLADQPARHDLLQAALSVGFQRLTSETLPSPKALADALGPDVKQGRLAFWTTDTAAHPLLEQLGLSGAFPTPPSDPGDVFASTVTNVANDKIDAYLHEDTTEAVDYDPANGRITEDVTITFHNTASAKLPVYVVGSYAGSGLPLGTNYMWLTLYSPFDMTSATLNGRQLTFAGAQAEVGVLARSAYLQIPAGGTAVVKAAFAGYGPSGHDFTAVLRLQPMANPTTASVAVTAAPGWHLAASTPPNWVAGPNEVQSNTWKFQK
jgi:hypothetical protein